MLNFSPVVSYRFLSQMKSYFVPRTSGEYSTLAKMPVITSEPFFPAHRQSIYLFYLFYHVLNAEPVSNLFPSLLAHPVP